MKDDGEEIYSIVIRYNDDDDDDDGDVIQIRALHMSGYFFGESQMRKIGGESRRLFHGTLSDDDNAKIHRLIENTKEIADRGGAPEVSRKSSVCTISSGRYGSPVFFKCSLTRGQRPGCELDAFSALADILTRYVSEIIRLQMLDPEEYYR